MFIQIYKDVHEDIIWVENMMSNLIWQFDIIAVYMEVCILLCGSHDTFLDCMSPGVQVIAALWFFLHSSHLCDSEDCNSPALTGLAFLAGP